MRDFNIDFPSDDEVNKSIDYILDRGLEKKQSLYFQLIDLIKMPIETLVFGIEDCIVISLSIYLLITFLFTCISFENISFVPIFFIISPSIFSLIMNLTFWKDKMNKTMEWKWVCKIDYKSMTLARMFKFGLFTMVTNVITNIYIWFISGKNINFLWITSLSFASLFLFSFISLYLLNKNIRHGFIISSLLWIILGILMALSNNLESLIIKIPFYVFLALVLVLSLGIIHQANIMFTGTMEGENNAYC